MFTAWSVAAKSGFLFRAILQTPTVEWHLVFWFPSQFHLHTSKQDNSFQLKQEFAKSSFRSLKLSSSRQASLNRSPYASHVSSWNRNKFTWNLVLQSDRFGKPKHLVAGSVQPSKHSVGAGCYCWCPFYSCVIRSILCESPFWERIKLTGHHNCHFCI